LTRALPDFRLDGKIALVTGGGSGIGRAVAETFARAGARLVLAGRREGPLRETARACGGEGAAIALAGDVTSAADRSSWLDAAKRSFGGLDVVVNNAGSASAAPVEETSEEEWARLWAVNLAAPVQLSREALPELRRRRGSIVNVSTGSSLRAVPGYGAYGASKAALNYVTQVLALEAAPDVRVNAILPGGVDTPIFDTFQERGEIARTKEWFASATPLGRMGEPSDVAAAALYLASGAASWVTGTLLRVDGGLNIA
jgi:NAD(P)-dependent dehydrogenase (short-subunit alcohol dehydrogenase family)